MFSLKKPCQVLWCGFLMAGVAFAEELPYVLEFYAIKVNGQEMGGSQILNVKSAGYFARAEDFENWGLNKAESEPIQYKNVDYYPLDKIAEYKFTLDEINQALSLYFPPKAFKLVTPDRSPEMLTPDAAESGAYANYDLYSTSNSSQQSNLTQLSGQFELGVFNPSGAGLTSFNGQNLYINQNGNAASARLIRLETNWTRDFPEKKHTVKWGDSNGRSGIWGRPVKFGGIQFGTNFATQPGFVTIPQPSFSGEAVLPSTAEVYVNGLRRGSQVLTPGPFQLSNFPSITGSGEAKIVVKDMLGREQVITQPFYLTSNLLRPGVDDYTVELGFIRTNFGLENATYGRPMVVATQRRGCSDKLTTELRGEALPDQQTAGIAVTYMPPLPVALTLATAISHSRQGSGNFLLLGVDHQSFGGLNFGLRGQVSSNYFTQIGSGQSGQTRQYTATMGLYTQFGSFGLSYNYLKNANPMRSEFLSLNYSTSVGPKASINVSLFRSMSGPSNQSLNLYLFYPLDQGVFASSNVSTQQGHASGVMQVQKSAPYGGGAGYRALLGAQQGAVQREEVGVTLQTDYGTYLFDAGRVPAQSSYRLTANGSVAAMNGKVFFARRSHDSFAVAQVPGFADVPVYLNGQLAAHTDGEGYAVLPGLLSYQKNKIMIDTKDMPFEAQIGKTEAEVIPHYHSGVSLKFSVELAVGALIKLVNEQGEVLPNGTQLVLEGSQEVFQVALRGEAYVTGLSKKKNNLKASWDQQQCACEIEIPENPGPLPHIGPVICKGIQP